MSQPKTTILAVRHGETLWNAQQRFQGHGDSPLTELGRQEVDALGERLKRMTIDRLISSDLGRAMASAAIIAKHTGHTIHANALLRERHYGVLEGLTIPEIEVRHAECYARLVAGDPDEVIAEGESRRNHYARIAQFMHQVLQEHAGRTVLIVAHGGVLECILRYVTELPLDHPRCFTAVNASLNIISHGAYFHTSRWVVETWGDVAHLNGRI